MPSNHLILCCPLLFLPPIFTSIRVFSDESALCIRWPKYWSFSINPSNKYAEFISFRTDWFDLLAVQGNLRSLTQHHNSKASILQRSTFFMVQLSHPYDYWKNHSFALVVICFYVICTITYISSVQSLSHVQLFATPWIAACQASLSITNSRSSLKLMSIE